MPIVPRGSASGLTGGSVPVKGGIVIDMASMNHILEVEVDNLQVLIEPGVIHRALNNELVKHGFFFPPDPGSSDMCTVGGLIANGGSGMHSVKYGTVKDYVLGLEVVLPNGDIINTGCKAPKTSSGYDLTRLFVGSEGTLGIITKARLKIHPLPETKAILVATFDRIEDAGRTAVTVLSSGVMPAAMEIMDGSAIDAVKKIDPTLGRARTSRPCCCSRWTATKRRSPGRQRKSARSASASAARPWSRRTRTRKSGSGPPGGWSASRSPG